MSLVMRILVIADDARFRSRLQGSLSRLGIEVEPCSCANQALQKLRDQPFDALVCDVTLPGTDGLSLIRGLRRRGFTLPCHMVGGAALSGTLELMRDAAWQVGAQSFSPKPINHHRLGAALTGKGIFQKRSMPRDRFT